MPTYSEIVQESASIIRRDLQSVRHDIDGWKALLLIKLPQDEHVDRYCHKLLTQIETGLKILELAPILTEPQAKKLHDLWKYVKSEKLEYYLKHNMDTLQASSSSSISSSSSMPSSSSFPSSNKVSNLLIELGMPYGKPSQNKSVSSKDPTELSNSPTL